MKKEKNPANSIKPNPSTDTRAPNTRVAAPSSVMDASSSLIGGIRSFHFCASTRPSAPPTSPPSPEIASASVSALSDPPVTRFLAYSANTNRPKPQNW